MEAISFNFNFSETIIYLKRYGPQEDFLKSPIASGMRRTRPLFQRGKMKLRLHYAPGFE